MRTAGYYVREHDPFDGKIGSPARREAPPAGRIRLMWQKMRGPIIERFPKAPGQPNDIDAY